MYRLAFQSGRYEGKRLVVRQGLIWVGRDAECHLCLSDDDLAQPRHACLEERGTGVYLSSAVPEHPVFRNGQAVTEPVRLAHDDELVIGQTRVRFQDIIAPHERLRPSWGLLQPSTILFCILILVLELGLVGFLLNWQDYVIRPDTEKADKARAEEIRAELEASADASGKSAPPPTGPAAPASVVTLPGTSPARVGLPSPEAPEVPEPEGAAALPETDVGILDILDEADFTPADTNISLVPLPSVSVEDPRMEEARNQLALAVSAMEFSDYASAFRLFNQIHQSVPDFLPAHAEHARLLENRGQLDAARQRWTHLLENAPVQSPLHAEARGQLKRLNDLRELQTRLLNTPHELDLNRLPRQVRIAGTEAHRMPADGDIAEMRVLSATIELSPDEPLFKEAVLQVFITFYDMPGGQPPRPTKAITTPSPATLHAPFASRRSLTVESTYVVPRGMREREKSQTGTDASFYGYTIHVFSGQILQDAFGKPRRLLELPLHMPKTRFDED